MVVIFSPQNRRGVAQLVERLVWDQDAAGSNPVTPTIKETSFVYHGKRGFSLRTKGLKKLHLYAILIKEKERDKLGFAEE